SGNVIEADHGEIVGDADANFPGGINDGKRHDIIAAEDGVRTLGCRQQVHPCGIAALIAEISGPFGVDGLASFSKDIAEAARSLDVGGGVGHAANKADPPVTPFQEQSPDITSAL